MPKVSIGTVTCKIKVVEQLMNPQLFLIYPISGRTRYLSTHSHVSSILDPTSLLFRIPLFVYFPRKDCC